MNKQVKLIISLILFGAALLGTVALVVNNIYDYLIISIPLTVILGLWLLSNVVNQRGNAYDEYVHTLNRIIRVYDPIIVDTDKFPKLNNKSVLNAKKITDLVDAQAESRKPIYYIKGEDATAFYLLNDDILLVYFLKANDEEECELERELKKVEFQSSINLDAVKDFDRTVVVQANNKAYKVSPIRDKKEEKKVEKEEVKEEKVEEIKEDKKEEKKEKKAHKIFDHTEVEELDDEINEYKEFMDFYKTLNNQNVDFSNLTEKQMNRFKLLIDNLDKATNNNSLQINDFEKSEVNRIKKLINVSKDDIEIL